jgi:hypothetical protein
MYVCMYIEILMIFFDNEYRGGEVALIDVRSE